MLSLENIRIEDILLKDMDTIEQIALLEAEIFSDAWSFHAIQSTVKQKHTFCAAVKENEKVLGYFLCYYVLDECEIARIAVAEQARRRGIGQILFEHMEKICREKQITTIMLDVRQSNRVAIIFYEKNGFETDGIRKLFYGGEHPEDAVLMSKKISN